MLVDARSIVLDFLMSINIPGNITEAMLVLDADKHLLSEDKASLTECIYALDPNAQFLIISWQFISSVPMAWLNIKYEESIVEFWFNYTAFLKANEPGFKIGLLNMQAEQAKRSIIWDIDINYLGSLQEFMKNYGIKVNKA